MTQAMEKYFGEIDDKLNRAYGVANLARSKAEDPDNKVEIPIARTMAERVESLVGVVAPQIIDKGIPSRIEELENEFGKLDWRVALTIGLEVVQEKFCKFNNKIDAMNTGIRVGFAYVTNGLVASPLEGFIGIDIRKRKDGAGEYMAVNYAGPVRSAGGTGASISVLIADYIRKYMGYMKYDPTEREMKRAITELTDYHERITNLQYFPSEEEIAFLVQNLPVQIDGDPTEELEVSNYKDLDRIATNRIRNGFCLVIGECLAQKAPKIWKQLNKWGKDFKLDDWFFTEKFVSLQKKIKSKKGSEETKILDIIKEDHTFIKDLVAGRPIISYPLAKGGLRLRYGRSRNTGISGCAIHPATMAVLDSYIGIGTQLKWERPSKGTALSLCEYIEGPIVKLKSGEVIFLDETNFENYLADISEILFLGDALIPYGDFLNRAHILVPPGYCEEWWLKELKSYCSLPEEVFNITGLDLMFVKKLFDDPIKTRISAKDAVLISKKIKVPLHPRYTFHWKDIDQKHFLILLAWLLRAVVDKDEPYKIVLPLTFKTEENILPKRALELLGVPHKVFSNEYVIIEGDWAVSFMVSLGFYEKEANFKDIIREVNDKEDVLATVNKFSEVFIKDKSGLYIGARMGRPEKAKMRKLTGSPHVLFPVGAEGGRLRCFQSALEVGKITAEFPNYYCDVCNSSSIYTICEFCSNRTRKLYFCLQCNKTLESSKCRLHGVLKPYSLQGLDIQKYWASVQRKFNIDEMPSLVKGVRGTSNLEHIPENLGKGILRAIYDIYVNKDGTVRYDMTQMPLTHFKSKEIGTSVEKLISLGYDCDIFGDKLVSEEQILELKPQDVVLPSCKESIEEGSDKILFRVSKFIDDLLKYFYGVDSYYNLEKGDDLIGHLIISLAPHTSAGVVGRIIGFSNTQCCYAHPMWHCAQRRDCDGDECGIMLLMDGLLNFSRKFLPAHRGATQDACLVLTSSITPSEVDDMVFDMDVAWEYPLDFYKACERYANPWEIKIDKIGDRLDKPNQYEKFGFTHNVRDINSGVVFSSYKRLPTMREKVVGQMILAEKIRAVDENNVAMLVIDRHFIRDIKGNLRKFSMQQFRCVDCNLKYRRPPLLGKCLKCDGKLLFTVSAGSVMKYLEPTLELARKYKLSPYMQQTLELLEKRIHSFFGKDPERQEGLAKWFS